MEKLERIHTSEGVKNVWVIVSSLSGFIHSLMFFGKYKLGNVKINLKTTTNVLAHRYINTYEYIHKIFKPKTIN